MKIKKKPAGAGFLVFGSEGGPTPGDHAARRVSPKNASFAFTLFSLITSVDSRVDPINTCCHVESVSPPS